MFEQYGNRSRSGLRYSSTFAPDGKWAAASFETTDGHLELEIWRLRAGKWKPAGTGISVGGDSQILPLRDGRILLRSGLGHGHVLVLAEPPINGNTASEKWSVRTIAELPFPGVRLISAAPSDRNSLAIMVTHDRGTTRFWRLLVSGELVCFPLEFAGLCGGGVWLDNRGRRLAVNRSVEGRPSPPVMIDLYNHKVETVFSISPNTSDRVELYSPRSSLLVVSTDAGGTEWIGFAHLRTCEQLWFPEETCSSTGMRALALDLSGERLLLHEQRGVLSGLAMYDIVRQCRKELTVPPGCIRGRTIWNKHGLSVPWSTPMTSHAIVRLDNDGQLPEGEPEPSDAIVRVVTVDGADDPSKGSRMVTQSGG